MEVGTPVPAKPPAYHREPVLPVAAVKKVPPPLAKNPASNNNRGNKNVENKNVNFNSSGEDEKKREKYLTAKYGAHQMALIRKRLKVEMWIFDQLQELYETEVSPDFILFRGEYDYMRALNCINVILIKFHLLFFLNSILVFN